MRESRIKMFFTGVFKIDGKSALISHKLHDREKYDDDVISWFSEADGEEQSMYSDGFVSNKGEQMTIHIRPEYIKEETIEWIKEFFFHSGEKGISEIKTAVFHGWDIEFFIAGINKGPFRVLKDADSEEKDSVYVVNNSQEQDIFQCAVHQAWLDMCRTLRTKKQKEWKQSQQMLAERLKTYFEESPEVTKEAFDGWYGSVNSDIRTAGDFNVGKAQKLINMAFKYLYCCNDLRNEKTEYFTYCHMPLDGYTLGWYKANVNKEYSGAKWSEMENANQYKSIVDDIRGHFSTDNLLEREFKIWQSEKKKAEKKELLICANKIMKSNACDPELKKLLQDYCDELENF